MTQQMALKDYQKTVMADLSGYMEKVNECGDLFLAWRSYWSEKGAQVGFRGVPVYNNAISGTPHVCMKVPTGGGKTYMACAAIKNIFDAMPQGMHKVVVWLAPSDSILNQTVRALSDPTHPYRMRLDADFAGRVGIYTKDMLINGQNFSPDTVREMLTICVLSYSSLRINSRKKDVRKIYQENGNLLRFAEYFKNDSVLLANTPDTALIQTLRHLAPVAIVDESHNAGSALSTEMLNNLNPSFILDLTATPRNNSNIISYVDARALKKENMVKLPVVVYNRSTRQSVIQDAIQLRDYIEAQAVRAEEEGGRYIRPIVLFQAQPDINDDSETFGKIRAKLIEMGIPEDEIAIKTSDVDDIGNTDLMSRSCRIRYIITVNALKEGWDCPFAYILASLANKTSKVDVEQIVGRILRQPYTARHSAPLLNSSYVITCSRDFHSTLENVVRGLNNAGFSRRDYRVGDAAVPGEEKTEPEPERTEYDYCDWPSGGSGQEDAEKPSGTYSPEGPDDFDDINPREVKASLENQSDQSESHITEMERQAEAETEAYENNAGSPDDVNTGGTEQDMVNQIRIQEQFRDEVKNLKIPQFFMKCVPDIFSGYSVFLEKENLSEGFSLAGQDAQVDFELAADEMYHIDIQKEGDAVPKYKRLAAYESLYVRQALERMPEQKRIDNSIRLILEQLNKNNRYNSSEMNDYVHRIIKNMSDQELDIMNSSVPSYSKKIQDKIKSLEGAYREKQFYKWLDSGKVFCSENYILPDIITPIKTTSSIPRSLYEEECDNMNDFEHRVIDEIVALDNIRWWHRIIDRKGFYINGAIHHYPDFMVMTDSGCCVLIEAKGDYLDGSDSSRKLKLGRTWMSYAGAGYKYFMVYENKEPDGYGAYTLDGFIGVLKSL